MLAASTTRGSVRNRNLPPPPPQILGGQVKPVVLSVPVMSVQPPVSPKVTLIGRHYRGRALETGGEQALSRRGRSLGRNQQSDAQESRDHGGAHRNSGAPGTRAD